MKFEQRAEQADHRAVFRCSEVEMYVCEVSRTRGVGEIPGFQEKCWGLWPVQKQRKGKLTFREVTNFSTGGRFPWTLCLGFETSISLQIFFSSWIGLSQGWPTCKREKSEASLIGRHKSPRAFAKNPKLKTSKAFWCLGYFPPCSDGKVSVKILTSFARERTPIHYLSLWRFLSLAGWDVFHTLNLLNEASSDLSSKCKVSIISRNLALKGVPRWPSS